MQGLTFVPLSLDEKIALSILVIGVAAIIHGFSYTTAEGASVVQRILLRRGADAVALVGAYLILRLWS